MGVRYDRLFHMMIDQRITNSQLMKMCGFSANIITRLKRNEYISMESLESCARHWSVKWMTYSSLATTKAERRKSGMKSNFDF